MTAAETVSLEASVLDFWHQHTILHFSYAGLQVVQGQVRHLCLQAVEIHLPEDLDAGTVLFEVEQKRDFCGYKICELCKSGRNATVRKENVRVCNVSWLRLSHSYANPEQSAVSLADPLRTGAKGLFTPLIQLELHRNTRS